VIVFGTPALDFFENEYPKNVLWPAPFFGYCYRYFLSIAESTDIKFTLMNAFSFSLINARFVCLLLTFSMAFIFTSEGQTDPIQLKYLGTAGWQITDGKITVLVDPYISRVKLGTGPGISPEDTRETVLRSDYFVSDTVGIDSLITEVDYILVHHSHFDHLSDVPYIAKKTGARVIGTETTCNILRAYGIPDEQLYPVKGGEDYQFENFSVRVIPSIHSALNNKHYIDSRVYNEVPRAPLRVSEFIEGGSLMFLARFTHHDVLTMGSMNFVERELQGIEPDILLAGVNQSQLGLYKYNERLLAVTGYPEVIIPSHWDNFRLPYGFSQEAAVKLKLIPFKEDVAKLSPNSRVIIPQHLGTITIR
jgi:L-ascorbate metabolism protein UlaG (beta-lactamase superfamily)